MKRKLGKRLVLHRETLRHLDSSLLSRVAGGVASGRTECYTRCATNCGIQCVTTGPGTEGSICATCYECSNGCETGGACTVSC